MARDNAHDATCDPVVTNAHRKHASKTRRNGGDNDMMVTGNPVCPMRAESAKVYSLGQRPRYTIIKLLSRCKRKSSEASNHGINANGRYHITKLFPIHQAYLLW